MTILSPWLFITQKTVRDKVAKQLEKGRLKVGSSLMGSVIQSGEEHLVREIPPKLRGKLYMDPEIIPQCFIYLPLVGVEKVVGVLGLSRLPGEPEFKESELVRMRNAANAISEFMAKRHLYDQQMLELDKRTKAEVIRLVSIVTINSCSVFLANCQTFSSDMEAVLQGLTNNVRDHFGVVCCVHVVDSLRNKLRPLAVSHYDKGIGHKIRSFFEQHYFDVDYSMIGTVVGKGEEFFLPEVTKRDHKWFDSDDPELIPASLLFLPITGRSRVLGILDITKTEKGDKLEETELVYLREVAKIVALFIENHHLFGKHRKELNRRKKAEELLREQNDRIMRNEKELRGILDSMPILVSRIDRELKYQFANKTYKKVLGLDPEWMEGRHISEIMNEEMYKRVLLKLNRVFEGEVMMYQTHGQLRNGKSMHFDVVNSPDYDLAGNVTGILSCIVDISDRAKAEQDLEMSEERLRIIFDNVEDVISTFNEEGRLESVNRTYQGLRKEDVIGTNILDYYQDPEVRRFVQSGLNELIGKGTPFSMENQFIGADGTVLVCKSTCLN